MRCIDLVYNAVTYTAIAALLGAMTVQDWRSGLLTAACVAVVCLCPEGRRV